jgi:hypothetical protein
MSPALLVHLADPKRPMWSARDIMAYLGCSKPFAYSLLRREGCPTVKLSAKWYRVPREAFLAWLAEQPFPKAMNEARARREPRDA